VAPKTTVSAAGRSAGGGAPGASTAQPAPGPAGLVVDLTTCMAAAHQQLAAQHVTSHARVSYTDLQHLLISLALPPLVTMWRSQMPDVAQVMQAPNVLALLQDAASMLVTDARQLAPGYSSSTQASRRHGQVSRSAWGQQPLLPPSITYQALGQLLLLQGWLPAEYEQQLRGMEWNQFSSDPRVLQPREMAPWQWLVSCMRVQASVRVLLSTSLTTGSSPKQDVAGKHVQLAIWARSSIESGLRCEGLLHMLVQETDSVCPASHDIINPSDHRQPSPLTELAPCSDGDNCPTFPTHRSLQGVFYSLYGMDQLPSGYMSPFTLMALLERYCVLGVALCTELCCTALPMSLVVGHAAAPSVAAQLTALLLPGARQPLWGRSNVQGLLCTAGRLVADMFRNPAGLDSWLRSTCSGGDTRVIKHKQGQEQKRQHDQLKSMLVQRAMVLLLACEVNARGRLLTESGCVGHLRQSLFTLSVAVHQSAGSYGPLPVSIQQMAGRLAGGRLRESSHTK
jgi:hypothetical protein